MIKSFNDRELILGMRVQCYRNLNTPNSIWFSLKDKKTRLVAAHGNGFRIENVKCHVGKGIHKIREKKVRHVCAWLEGDYTGECEMNIDEMKEVTFNPYHLDHFIIKENGEKLEYIDVVFFKDGKCYTV